MGFLVDSNCFIQAANHFYSFDFHPGFWDWLCKAHSSDGVCSIYKVRDEMIKVKDDVGNWANKQRTFFAPGHDSETQAELTKIMAWVFQNYSRAEAQRFARGADPILIACALAKKHTVVTFEVSDPNWEKVKIPDVCRQFGVNCITLYDMLRTSGAKFVLSQAKTDDSADSSDSS